jgi:hypothetical protein
MPGRTVCEERVVTVDMKHDFQAQQIKITSLSVTSSHIHPGTDSFDNFL